MKKLIILFTIILFISSVYSQWQQITSASNYSYTHIINVNGILYASTYGSGIQKSTDSSVTWQPVNNGLNTAQALTVQQMLSENNELFSATVGGMYKSTDGGTSWTKKSNGIIVGGGALYEFNASIFEDNNVLYTGAYTGIYRSTNDGENWIVTTSGSAVMPGFFYKP